MCCFFYCPIVIKLCTYFLLDPERERDREGERGTERESE